MKAICRRKMRRTFDKKNICEGNSDTEIYERYTVCKRVTDVLSNTPIVKRKCYVPGGGQLCRKCCIELYGTDDLRSLQSAELEQIFLRR